MSRLLYILQRSDGFNLMEKERREKYTPMSLTERLKVMTSLSLLSHSSAAPKSWSSVK